MSDLPALIEQADIWIYGHVHNSFDYKVRKCWVVTSPQGYPLNLAAAETPAHLVFENVEFDAHFTIEV